MAKKKTSTKRKPAAKPKATQPCSTCDRSSMPSSTSKEVSKPAPKAPSKKKAPKRNPKKPKIDYRKGPTAYAKAKSYKRQPTLLG